MICLITIIGTIIALAYVLLAQSWWTSTAIVRAPRAYQLFNYKKEINEYSNVIDYKPWASIAIFNHFIFEFNSPDNKIKILESSEELNKIRQALNINFEDELSELKFYSDWSERIEAKLVDKKN